MSYGSKRSNGSSDIAGIPTLFVAVLRKRVYLLMRYPMNTIAQIVTVYLFFAVIFFGGKAAAGSIGAAGALSGTFGGLIVGWFLWTMALAAYFSLAASVTHEAQWGTLEQLYMSPFGFGSVMAASVVAYLLESMLWGAIILPLMLVTTGQHLAVDLLTVVPIVVLTLLPVVGIGFVFAGLALLYKRVENLSQLMQFVLIGLIAAPVADFTPLRYLPLVQGSSMLQQAMQNGVRLWQFSPTDLGILVVAALGYCLLGFYVFTLAARRARRKGVLGHY